MVIGGWHPPIKVELPPEGGYVSVPRMTIDHDTTSLSYNDNTLDANAMKSLIMLGGVRRRNMYNWGKLPGTIGPGDGRPSGLECQSVDYEHGMPTDLFPWDLSNFPEPETEDEKLEASPECGSCIFANWVKDPSAARGSQPARCDDIIIGVFLVPVSYSKDPVYTNYDVAQLALKKSALVPAREYMQDFAMKKMAPYQTFTSIVLRKNITSTFSYSVPSFTSHAEVDEEMYPVFSRILRDARASLLKPIPRTTAKPAGGFLSVGPPGQDEVAPRYSGKFFN